MNKYIIFIHNGKNLDFSQFLLSGPHEGGNILSSLMLSAILRWMIFKAQYCHKPFIINAI